MTWERTGEYFISMRVHNVEVHLQGDPIDGGTAVVFPEESNHLMRGGYYPLLLWTRVVNGEASRVIKRIIARYIRMKKYQQSRSCARHEQA